MTYVRSTRNPGGLTAIVSEATARRQHVLYTKGVKVAAIAVKLGVSSDTVYAAFRRHGLVIFGKQKLTNAMVREAHKWYMANGRNATRTAHRLGVERWTVSRRFRQLGLLMRPRRSWSTELSAAEHPHTYANGICVVCDVRKGVAA